MIRNHSSILESWYKFQPMPYADFNICWFQLCAHIQIVPICCLNVWVAKSHTWGDERRTGIAYSLNVEAFLKKKKKKSRHSLLFKIVWLWFCDGSGHHYVFTEYVQVQYFCRLVMCFEFVLAQLDLQRSKAVFQKCIFRSLTSWWMAFQEFLVSVSDRPLLQPISTINNTFSRHTRIHILMYTYGHWF